MLKNFFEDIRQKRDSYFRKHAMSACLFYMIELPIKVLLEVTAFTGIIIIPISFFCGWL